MCAASAATSIIMTGKVTWMSYAAKRFTFIFLSMFRRGTSNLPFILNLVLARAKNSVLVRCFFCTIPCSTSLGKYPHWKRLRRLLVCWWCNYFHYGRTTHLVQIERDQSLFGKLVPQLQQSIAFRATETTDEKVIVFLHCLLGSIDTKHGYVALQFAIYILRFSNMYALSGCAA